MSAIRHARNMQPSAADREPFIQALYFDATEPLDTMQVVARMYEDFGIVVTEAEVCRATRRPGERTVPYKPREVP